MGKEANIAQKSRKSVVQLYRTFLKISMACLIYTIFSLIFEKQAYISVTGAFQSESVPITLAVIGAVLYQFTHYLHKYGNVLASEQQARLKAQITALIRIVLFFFGTALCIWGAVRVHKSDYFGIVIVALGLIMAQLIYDNKKLSSHVSTFSENAATGFVIVTMKLIYDGSMLAFASAAIGILLLALQEIAFHYYNIKKHPMSGYTLTEVKTIRVMVFVRNLLVAFILIAVWSVLVITGSVEALLASNLYEKATKIIPILISLITVSVLLYNNFIKKPPKARESYDVKISKNELERELCERYGKECESLKALDYVTEKMTAARGYKRHDGEDYFVHPLAVAGILLGNAVVTDKIIAVALLHDCIEDIDGADEEIRGIFGTEICELVRTVSKGADIDYGVSENMKEYLENAFSSEIGALVKTADRMNNNSTMQAYSARKKQQKFLETKTYYLPLVAMAKERYAENSNFFALAEKFFSYTIE